MEQRRNAFDGIVMTVSIVVASLVIFFWLRELDLSFLIRCRAPVALLVLLAGAAIGVKVGISTSPNVFADVQDVRTAGHTIFGTPILYWFLVMMLLSGVSTGFFLLPSALATFWNLHESAKGPSRLLTESLSGILGYASLSLTGFTMFYIGLRQLRKNKRAVPAE
ncbi:MAG TPA: hypothetical protein PLZ36_09055 [Armatimonadota bacterium]|nr:hypothetical protein [Armatimonadota bacterium]